MCKNIVFETQKQCFCEVRHAYCFIIQKENASQYLPYLNINKITENRAIYITISSRNYYGQYNL